METKKFDRKPISLIAVAAMICGIASFIPFYINYINTIFLILAIVLGIKAKNDIRYNKEKSGLIFAQIGIYSAIIQFVMVIIIFFPLIPMYLFSDW